jgi:hypothetical protein
MSKGKLERIIQRNLMMENKYITKKMLLKEGDVKELETKKQTILSYLEDLKSQNPLFKGKIQGYIDDMNSIDPNNVCSGNNLSSDAKTKLDDAKDGLRLAKSMAKDKNNVIPKIEQEIPFIESYCSTKTVEKEKQEDPAPTGDQYYKSQQASGVQRMTQSQPSNVQNNIPSKIPDSERRPRFMDELERLNTDPKFSKQDIIDYVKSKVVIKTT